MSLKKRVTLLMHNITAKNSNILENSDLPDQLKLITTIGEVTDSDKAVLLKMWTVRVKSGKRPLRKHSHIRFEISKVLSGSGTYSVGSKTYDIKKGDMFVFTGNEQHCITNVDENGLQIINLHFEPRYLWGKASDSLSSQNIGLCFSHSDAFHNRIPAQNCQLLSFIFDKICNELLNLASEYPLAVKSCLNLLLITLIRDYDYAPAMTSFAFDKTEPVRHVIRYIDEHLCEPLNLNALASIAGMSPNYFSSLFHSISGIHLWDYVNSRRIEAAIQLLTNEDLNIIDIAMQCGFNNTANFNKIFKKFTGMTPREYRHSDEYII